MEYTMDNLVELRKVPREIQAELPWRCTDPNCNAPILYSENLRHARCANPLCPQHMSLKIAQIFSDLKMKSLGAAFARQLIIALNIKHPLQAFDPNIVQLYPDKSSANYKTFSLYLTEHPTVDYWKLYTYLYIPGFKEDWMQTVNTCTSSIQVASQPCPLKMSPMQWEEAKKNFKYIDKLLDVFDVKFQHSSKILEVTLTGSMLGYSNRDDFIVNMNRLYGDRYTIKKVGKKKSAHFLISDSDMSGHSKTQAALEGGVPIINSTTFEALLKCDRVWDFLEATKHNRRYNVKF